MQAVRAITAATVLDGVAFKLMQMQIEMHEPQQNMLDETSNLLKHLCALLVLVALMTLTAWKSRSRELGAPRIRAVRRLSDEGSDDFWSVIRESQPAGADPGTEGWDNGCPGL